MTALFEDIIFGPIHSRRLGLSLGVNLLPEHAKICNFDCIYCECGSNSERRGEPSSRRFADTARVKEALTERLTEMVSKGEIPNVITFAGNGEPTLHPDFEQIIDFTIDIRDRVAPDAKISVLSNATTLSKASVVRALRRIENPILKLDSAIQSTAERINRPTPDYCVESVIESMASLHGECIVQTMFLRDLNPENLIDNTSAEEVAAWIKAIERISPRQVMIYSIDRDTPITTLEKVSREELQEIASQIETPSSIA